MLLTSYPLIFEVQMLHLLIFQQLQFLSWPGWSFTDVQPSFAPFKCFIEVKNFITILCMKFFVNVNQFFLCLFLRNFKSCFALNATNATMIYKTCQLCDTVFKKKKH